MRYELYNVHLAIKNRQYNRFETVILFLTEFNKFNPDILPEKLFVRVTASVKALVFQILKKIKHGNGNLKEIFSIN